MSPGNRAAGSQIINKKAAIADVTSADGEMQYNGGAARNGYPIIVFEPIKERNYEFF